MAGVQFAASPTLQRRLIQSDTPKANFVQFSLVIPIACSALTKIRAWVHRLWTEQPRSCQSAVYIQAREAVGIDDCHMSPARKAALVNQGRCEVSGGMLEHTNAI